MQETVYCMKKVITDEQDVNNKNKVNKNNFYNTIAKKKWNNKKFFDWFQ